MTSLKLDGPQPGASDLPPPRQELPPCPIDLRRDACARSLPWCACRGEGALGPEGAQACLCGAPRPVLPRAAGGLGSTLAPNEPESSREIRANPSRARIRTNPAASEPDRTQAGRQLFKPGRALKAERTQAARTAYRPHSLESKRMYGPPPFCKRRVVGDGLCANVSGLWWGGVGPRPQWRCARVGPRNPSGLEGRFVFQAGDAPSAGSRHRFDAGRAGGIRPAAPGSSPSWRAPPRRCGRACWPARP